MNSIIEEMDEFAELKLEAEEMADKYVHHLNVLKMPLFTLAELQILTDAITCFEGHGRTVEMYKMIDCYTERDHVFIIK